MCIRDSSSLVYFGHILELLLHSVLEQEADAKVAPARPLLPAVTRLIDHFDTALSVVAQCARKTEMSRWKCLFGAVGAADVLIGHALSRGELETAVQLLLVVHELQPGVAADTTARVLYALDRHASWDLFQQVLSFVQATGDDEQRAADVIKRAAALAMRHKGPGDADSPLVVLGSALGPDLDTYSQKQGGAGVHSPVPVSPSPQTCLLYTSPSPRD